MNKVAQFPGESNPPPVVEIKRGVLNAHQNTRRSLGTLPTESRIVSVHGRIDAANHSSSRTRSTQSVCLRVPPDQNQEMIIGLKLIQLVENVFLDLRPDVWDHPDNRGWAIFF